MPFFFPYPPECDSAMLTAGVKLSLFGLGSGPMPATAAIYEDLLAAAASADGHIAIGSLGKGTAFGASLNNNATTATPARKGSVAWCDRAEDGTMSPGRREIQKPAAVFIPGEPQEVPVLEKPPVIGVIEYVDEPEPRLDDSDAQLANILGETDRGKINVS
ncbi:hypothetical protein AB4305_27525 [Nocardia sp. 2YAB30]|uniref:hypothetical protein n=1 Tax=unclassified Nocardia TaxID=2637762 RepID=UPI003F947786